MVLPTAISFVAGVILRLSLFRSSLPEWLSTKTEVVTPLTSWSRGKVQFADFKEKNISNFSRSLDIYIEPCYLLLQRWKV